MSTEVGKLYIAFDADGRPYIQGLQKIDAKTKAFQRDQESAFGRFGTRLGQSIKLGMAAAAAAVVAGGVLITKSLIKTAASYEYEMSRIKAVTSATESEMKAMGDLALKLGKDTVFSAGEAAQGINELGKAGVSVADILGGGIAGTLSLAAAGELEVAAAAEIASNAMNIFGLTGKDVSMVADTLAAAANASSLEVSDLAYSMKYAGPIAQSLGIPFQQLVAILAELGNQGIRGEQAGAGLASMLQALTAPTDAATKQLAQYGIAIYDAEHNMRSMPDILGDMNTALSDLDDEGRMNFVQAVFGKGSDSAIALKLIEGGSEALEEMTTTVSKQGEAARVSAEKMDNFRGSMEELRGSLETLAVKLGTPLMNALRPFVDKLKEGVDWASDFYDDLKDISGWEGADLTGKIKIAWEELTLEFETWLNGTPAMPAKVYPVWADKDEFGNIVESLESIPMGVLKAEVVFEEQATQSGLSILRDWGEKIGTAAGEMLVGVLGGDTGQSVWAQAGKAIAEGFADAFWDAISMNPQEQEDFEKRTGGGVVTPWNAEEAGKWAEPAAQSVFVILWDTLKSLFSGSGGEKNAEDVGAATGKVMGAAMVTGLTPLLIGGIADALEDPGYEWSGLVAARQFFSGFSAEMQSKLSNWQLSAQNLWYSLGRQSGAQGGFGGSGSGSAILDFADNYLGTPYVFGGESPGGFDCSGLMWYAYQHFGIDIPRLSQDQFAAGRPVSMPGVGDLVFFKSSGTWDAPGHVGMYAGNGMFLEAPYTGASVRFSELANRRDYAGARSFLYDAGGLVPQGITVVNNASGANEVILPGDWIEQLTSDVNALVTAIRDQVEADETAKDKQAATNVLILERFGERSELASSYISREQARLAMLQATGAEIEEQAKVMTDIVTLADQAVAEAAEQLRIAKEQGVDQLEINRLAADLFGLQENAADAREALADLADVPELDDSLRRWSDATSQLETLFDLLSDSSRAFELQSALLPRLMSSMRGEYEATLDMMRGATTPEDIMGYAGDALSQITRLYSAEKGQLDRTLDQQLESLADQEDAWQAAWDKRAQAVQDSASAASEALSNAQSALRESQQKELEELEAYYRDRLRAMEDAWEEEDRAKARRQTAAELAGLYTQGGWTEADFARIQQLKRAQIEQEEQWAREDARTSLEAERDAAVKRLQAQQEAATKALEAQAEALQKAQAAQEKALQAEAEAHQKAYDAMVKATEDAYQAQLDTVVDTYAGMATAVLDAETAMLDGTEAYVQALTGLGDVLLETANAVNGATQPLSVKSAAGAGLAGLAGGGSTGSGTTGGSNSVGGWVDYTGGSSGYLGTLTGKEYDPVTDQWYWVYTQANGKNYKTPSTGTNDWRDQLQAQYGTGWNAPDTVYRQAGSNYQYIGGVKTEVVFDAKTGKWIPKFDDGGWLPPGISTIANFTGYPEMVIPYKHMGSPMGGPGIFPGEDKVIIAVEVKGDGVTLSDAQVRLLGDHVTDQVMTRMGKRHRAAMYSMS